MKILVADCEGDSLTPTRIWVLAGDFGDGVKSTTNYDIMRKQLLQADILVGHNFARFDVPVFERILGIPLKCKIVDTLALSWYLYPDRNQHGLEAWGEDLGVKKPPIIRWDDPDMLPEYINRCKEDVKINMLLWKKMWKHLMLIYKDEAEVWKFLDYLSFKMDCAVEQERSGWKLDKELASSSLETLTADKEKAVQELIDVMPMVPTYQKKKRPAKPYKADGTYSVHGAAWFHQLRKLGYDEDYDEEIKIVIGEEPGNPNSSQQVKKWLFDNGWEPETFKQVKDDDGNTRQIPQINLEHGGGICPSIQRLYDEHPEFRFLEGLGVVSHRISILSGFLDSVDDEGSVKAQIAGLTNTLRFKHKTVVNLPGVDKKYGKIIRGSLIAGKGRILCGSDMSSLEDRLKCHYIFPHDPEYVAEISTPGYDPHMSLAVSDGAMTEKQMEDYKTKIDMGAGPIRKIYKSVNYAAQYGAGGPRIAVAAGTSIAKGKALWEAYWKKNWAIKEVAKEQKIITVRGQMWLKNPINGFYYSLRFEKDIFSTLVQGSASYVFDLWVQTFRKRRPQLTAQFHDEVVLCVKQGQEVKAEKLLREAIAEVNNQLKLNRELGIDVQFGDRYSDIH